MKVVKNLDIPFVGIEKICAVNIFGNEIVLLADTGVLASYTIGGTEAKTILSVEPYLNKEGLNYSDGGYDLYSPQSIYKLDDIYVVVNDYKTHGCVVTSENQVHLWRKDYHAEYSKYPIAIYKDHHSVPHIIYANAWNRIDIMNLNTLQILTADKSLIEDCAEEKAIEYANGYEKGKHHFPWPREYDYFYGELLMSPDNTKFLSKGWVWGSADYYYIFDTADFVTNKRIKYKIIAAGDHCCRAACWLTNTELLIKYSPFAEGDEGATIDSNIQFHVYNVCIDQQEPVRIIETKTNKGLSDKLYYYKAENLLISFSKENGILVNDLDGNLLLENTSIKPDAFCEKTGKFIEVMDNNTISIYSLHK